MTDRRTTLAFLIVLGVGTALPGCGDDPDDSSRPGVSPGSDECSPDAAPFGGGDGTDDDPWLVCEPEHLASVADRADDHATFRLDDDIDMSEYAGDFEIIGPSDERPFNGNFRGNDREIRRLTLEADDPGNAVGIFGYVNGATISDLTLVDIEVSVVDETLDQLLSVGAIAGYLHSGTLENAEIRGNESRVAVQAAGFLLGVGGAVGRNEGNVRDIAVDLEVSGTESIGGLIGTNAGTVTDSSSSGFVEGTGIIAGGLVGHNQDDALVEDSDSDVDVLGTEIAGGLVGTNDGIVEACRASGSVEATRQVGGLVGRQNELDTHPGIVDRCRASGHVEGVEDVGGLIGRLEAGKINNSYTLSTATGTDRVGGLAGSVGDVETESDDGENGNEDDGEDDDEPRSLAISYCYAAGSPSADDGSEGGLVAEPSESLSVEASYWDTRTSGIDDGVGEGMTTTEFGEQDKYDGWDFDDVWTIAEVDGEDRAQLRWIAD